MTRSGSEIPVKALIAGAAVIICGIMLLLMNPFSSSSSVKESNADLNKKPVKTFHVQENDSEPDDAGSGFQAYDPDEGDVGDAARVVQGAAALNQGTNDTTLAGLNIKYQALLAMRSDSDRRAALLQFGRDLARSDPVGGLALIKSLAPQGWGHWFGSNDISLVCQGFFEAAAQLDLSNAISMALDLPRQFHRSGLGTVMQTWASTDLNAALAYLSKLPPEYARHGTESVFSVWGEKDPGAALGEAAKFKDSASDRMFEAAVMSAIVGWAKVDPKSAWAYMLNPDDSVKDAFAGRDRYLTMIAAKWAEKDLDAAMAAIKALTGNTGTSAAGIEGGDDYARMVSFITMRLLDTAPEAAGKLFDREKWLAGNPWLSTRNIGRLIGEGSVTEAAEWMANIPDKNMAFDCARKLAAQKTRNDYDAVFKWASLIQDDYVKAGALSNVAVVQSQYDINRPIDWIYDLPAGYARERSVAGYVLGKIRQTGDMALEVTLRKQMALPQIDMAGVAHVLEQSKIAPQDKLALLDLIEGRRPVRPLVIQ